MNELMMTLSLKKRRMNKQQNGFEPKPKRASAAVKTRSKPRGICSSPSPSPAAMLLCEAKEKAECVINEGRTSGSQIKVVENGSCSEVDTETSFTPQKIALCRNILYRFRCPSFGTYRCLATRLVFVVTREAELQYRIIPWEEAFGRSLDVNEKEKKVAPLLQSQGRTPAGPLYDIECPERAVCELHLPHCEPQTADLSKSQLSVAHFSDSSVDSIQPVRITDSHVVIEVSELSPYGLTNPSEQNEPVSGQVLLFRTPKNWKVIKVNVFLLPRNVPLESVECKQLSTKQIIDAPPACELLINHFYSVDCPLAEIVQPKRARFDMDYEPNYHPLFEVRLPVETTKASLTVLQTENTENREVWSHEVNFTDPTCRVPRTISRMVLVSRLKSLRPEFIKNVSDPILNQLLDKLLAKQHLNVQEVETASQKDRMEKARDIIDIVIRNGSRAAEYLIETYCELDEQSDLSREMGRILKKKK